MPDVSVWQQGRPHCVLPLETLLSGIKHKDGFDMVDHVTAVHDFGLVVFDGHQTIIKLADPGDDKHSFEGLFDDAMGPADLKRRQLAEQVEEMIDVLSPLKPVSVRLSISLDTTVHLNVTARARGQFDAGEVIQRLYQDNAAFREEIRNAVFSGAIQDSAEFRVAISHEAAAEKPTLADGQDWSVSNT